MTNALAATQVQPMPVATTLGMAKGINVCGYLRDESGWGTAARSYVRALRALGVPLALNDVSALSSNRSADRTMTEFEGDNPFPLNLICVDPTQQFAVLQQLGEGRLKGRYNVGAWAWELPHFPAKWLDRLAFYDEIWVMSSFVANGLSALAPIPVVRIPPVLTVSEQGSREHGRLRLGVSPNEFVFLFVFDMHSHMARKNPLAAIDAFRLAFAPTDPARLVIKCVNGDTDLMGLTAMYERAQGHSIRILDGYWTLEGVQDLFAGCDAYVSLHRSEGLGLTIAEAMALGKPVIATGWSGNGDFMDVSNSFPVRYNLIEIPESIGPYRAGETWAEPSVEHAAALMRYVYEDREDASERGKAARLAIEREYSEERIAALIRRRLETISIRQDLATFRGETWSEVHSYQQLPARIRRTVADRVPAGSTVLVVSKGDEDLVKLYGRNGWHFPQAEGGGHLGFHPPDSRAAIKHLEDLRTKGADYLLFPNVAFWWLDYYVEFRKHLDEYYSRVWSDESCVIYQLRRGRRP